MVEVFEIDHAVLDGGLWWVVGVLERGFGPGNIAEGANRSSKKEYLQFLSVASGSLAEARYFLHLSRRLAYMGEVDYSRASKLAEETSKTLSGLIHALKGEV